jgi:polyketide synthase 12
MSQARHTGKLVLTMPRPLDPEGTVLITGGTGLLGGLAARRLVTGHGVRRLVLASRQGAAAAGAAELAAGLRELGAEVTIVACDAGDRDALAGVVAAIPAEFPLRGVVHAAGALRDGPVTAAGPDDLAAVWRPKAAGAWNLHQVTKDLDLAMFVMFSSLSGIAGNPGQSLYAAANVFLDLLAAARHRAGLPAVSLAWGLWAEDSSLTGQLDQAARGRLARSGIVPMLTGQALDLFDAAVADGRDLLIPAQLDLAALRAAARDGTVPGVFRALLPAAPAAGSAGAGTDLAARLAGLPADEQERVVLEEVRVQAAAVLGHAGAAAVDPQRLFRELGFDSLTAVELRNRLARVTGLRLPAALAFDYPTPIALAGYLLKTMRPADPAVASPGVRALAALTRLEQELQALVPGDDDRRQVEQRLRQLLWAFDDQQPKDLESALLNASTDEIVDLLRDTFGGRGSAEAENG